VGCLARGEGADASPEEGGPKNTEKHKIVTSEGRLSGKREERRNGSRKKARGTKEGEIPVRYRAKDGAAHLSAQRNAQGFKFTFERKFAENGQQTQPQGKPGGWNRGAS